MQTDKIIFVSLPRSGSTYLCNVVRSCFSAQSIDFLNVNPEISNIDQWKSNKQYIVNDNINVIKSLDLDINNIDSNFVNRMFLHSVTQPKAVVLKFFPFDTYDIGLDDLVAVSKRHRIRLFCLYRKNMLDALVSRLVKHQFGDDDIKDETLMLSTKFQYNKHILDNDIIRSYQLFYNMVNKLTSLELIEEIIPYDDLTFNPSVDANRFYKNIAICDQTVPTKKFISTVVKQHVLTQLPFLSKELTHSLKESGIPIVDDFYFSLNT
jgi:hypothetical protein